MEGKKCINCGQYKNCKDTYASWIFFVIGIIATIAIRVVTILIHLNPVYAKVAWYVGVSGFMMFFIYKFRVSQAKTKLIRQKGLREKITGRQQLANDDYDIIEGILCSLVSQKERVNYLFIFVLSALALLLAIYMDFFK
ncbi:MAG: hypothetical protein ABIE75_01230 [Candidatus Omnitrophota bacterium]